MPYNWFYQKRLLATKVGRYFHIKKNIFTFVNFSFSKCKGLAAVSISFLEIVISEYCLDGVSHLSKLIWDSRYIPALVVGLITPSKKAANLERFFTVKILSVSRSSLNLNFYLLCFLNKIAIWLMSKVGLTFWFQCTLRKVWRTRGILIILEKPMVS